MGQDSSKSDRERQQSREYQYQTQASMGRQHNPYYKSPNVYPDLSKMGGHEHYSRGVSSPTTPAQRVTYPTVVATTAQRVTSPTVVTPAQTVATPLGNFNGYGGGNGMSVRKEAEEFVIVNNVNNHGQSQYQMTSPTPSAPPEYEVAVPADSTLRPARPPPPRAMKNLSTPCSSATQAHTTTTTSSSSVPRIRSADDRFNCPTCGLLLGVTIFSCDRGHSSCSDCKLGSQLCGYRTRPGQLCRSPIGNMRNFMLEELVAEHQVHQRGMCPNAGCTLRYSMAELPHHLRACPYGETDCPVGALFGQCQQRFKVDAMASHFDKFHPAARLADFGKEMFLFHVGAARQQLFLLKNGPYNFLVHVKSAQQERKIYMTVQLYGTVVSASKWTYEFHVYNKSQPRRKFLFADSCHSVATAVDDIFKESRCATLPLDYAMSFVNENSLTYKFFIKKTEASKPKGRNSRNGWKNQNVQQE